MKINNSNNSLASSANEVTVRTNAAKTSAESAESPNVAQGVSVTLGSASSQLRSIENSFAEAPMMDAKKIAEIKQAISEGRFQINSSAIADGLISNVEDLLNADGRD